MNKANLAEPELICGLIKHDPDCIAALYDLYAATLLKIIYCSIKHQPTAEAILAATLTKACFQIKTQQLQNQRLLVWMAGIARELSRNPQ